MAREAQELARAARMLTGVRDVAEVGAQIVQSLVSLFGGHVGGVGLLEPDGSIKRVAVGGPGVGAVPRDVAIDTETGMVGHAFREGRLCWWADVSADVGLTMSDEQRRLVREMGFRAAVVTPLRYRDRPIGALLLAFRERRSFSPDETALVQTFADHAAVALGNAGVYEEAGRRRREAEVVAALVRRINSSLDVNAILQAVAEGARDLCRSDLARIALRDPESGAMVFRYWVNVRYRDYAEIRVAPGRGLGGQVLLTGAPFRTPDWLQDPRITKETRAVIEAEGTVAQLAVPIRIGDAVEGLLYVDNRSRRPFTDGDEAILMALADHAAIAIRNAQLFATVQTTGARLQALSTRLLEVQEAERRHIARELHDEVGQALTAVRINLLMLRRTPDAAAAEARIADSLGIVERILGSVRQLSLDLRPSLLDDLGLAAALRWYVDAQANRAGITASIALDPLAVEPSPDLATTCFRVTQEAVTNAVRHAHATRLEVELRSPPGALELVIRDDGVGFDVTAARRRAVRGGSLGLLGLEERVELAGGRVTIDSSPRGTRICARFPMGARP